MKSVRKISYDSSIERRRREEASFALTFERLRSQGFVQQFTGAVMAFLSGEIELAVSSLRQNDADPMAAPDLFLTFEHSFFVLKESLKRVFAHCGRLKSRRGVESGVGGLPAAFRAEMRNLSTGPWQQADAQAGHARPSPLQCANAQPVPKADVFVRTPQAKEQRMANHSSVSLQAAQRTTDDRPRALSDLPQT